MMKVLLLFFLLPFFLLAQNNSLFYQFGSPDNESLEALTAAPGSGVYMAGSFSSSLPWDQNALYSRGNTDVFLARLDDKKQVQWAVGGGSIYSDQTTGMCVDGQGNVYWAGKYTLEAQFDSLQLNAAPGVFGLFFFKYSPEGKRLWHHNISGNGLKSISAMSYSEDDGIYLSGYFEDSLFIGDTVLTAIGTSDFFVARFSSQGMLNWASRHGEEGVFSPEDLAIDANHNVLVVGSFQGKAIFANDTIKSNTADSDAFLAKFDGNGNPLWIRKAGGVHDSFGKALVIDSANYIYFTGKFLGVMQLSENLDIQTMGFNDNFFLLKYDPDGAIQWGKSLGNTGLDESGEDIIIQGDTLFLTGTFQNELQIEALKITGGGGFLNGFLSSFSLDGELISLDELACDEILLAQYLAIEGNGNLLVGGNFSGIANIGGVEQNSYGAFDIFLVEFFKTVTGIRELEENIILQLFPNPSDDHINLITNLNAYTIRWYSSQGQLLGYGRNIRRIDLTDLPSGIYFIEIQNKKGATKSYTFFHK